jgi:hypothetical protein
MEKKYEVTKKKPNRQKGFQDFFLPRSCTEFTDKNTEAFALRPVLCSLLPAPCPPPPFTGNFTPFNTLFRQLNFKNFIN